MKARLSLLFACVFLPMITASGAISIGGGNPVWQTFTSQPPAGEWSTLAIDGAASTIGTEAQLDVAVQLLSAANINTPLAVTSTQPPSQNNFARWNAPGQYVQIRTGNISYTVLMATLQNDTGINLPYLLASYDFGGGAFITEQVPGWRAYFSQTGSPGSWQNIPALNTSLTGSYSAVIDLGLWTAGSTLYLLWADENSALGPDGYYTLDNLLLGTTAGVSIGEPANGQTFVHGTNITAVASGFLPGTLTNLTFLLDGTPVGSSTAAPFRATLVGVSQGSHQLQATGQDAYGNSTSSAVVQFTVTPNLPAMLVFTNGTGLLTFEVQPFPSDGWTTHSIFGLPTDITNIAGLDAQVQMLAASNVNTALRSETTCDPDSAEFVSWQACRHNLLSRPDGNRCSFLLATLQNRTGQVAPYLEISYDMTTRVTNVVEHVPGLRAYRSLTGAPSSWQLIPEFTTDTAGHLKVGMNLGSWPSGANLYLLWADDNGPGIGQGYTGEGAYYLDNFSATLQTSLSITSLAGGLVELSWSEAAIGFQLEVSDTPDGGTWVPVLDQDEPSDGRHHVSTEGFLDAAFYRLAKP